MFYTYTADDILSFDHNKLKTYANAELLRFKWWFCFGNNIKLVVIE